MPEVEMDAHAADLGMMFYTGRQFPAKYRGGIFSAQHGSWNRTDPIGARVMFTSLNDDGSADQTVVFADGWLDRSTGEYFGRPVAVAQLRDGRGMLSTRSIIRMMSSCASRLSPTRPPSSMSLSPTRR